MPQSPDDESVHTSDATLGSAELVSKDLDALLRNRASVGKRVTQVATALAMVSFATAIILHEVLPTQLARQTPVVPSSVHGPIALVSNISFGTVIVNGREAGDHWPVVIRLLPGNNRIALTAPPFRPHTCILHGSAISPDQVTAGSDCTVISSAPAMTIDTGRAVIHPALLVGVPITGDDLPPDIRSRALQSLGQALASVPLLTTVPPGQFFATGLDSRGAVVSRRAATPTLAMAVAIPNGTPPEGMSSSMNPCDGFRCTGSTFAHLDLLGQFHANDVWLVGEGASLGWRFTTAAGMPVGAATFRTRTELTLALEYAGSTGWKLSNAFSSSPLQLTSELDSCSAGVELLLRMVSSGQYGATSSNVAPDRAAGCELRLQGPDGTVAGHFVWRFGVLLAADADAHSLLPGLPIAPGEEITAVSA